MVRRPVNNARYSSCSSAKLKDLNWERWWTDDSFGEHYLHVEHKDGETVHRVRARGVRCPRIEFANGRLMWLYAIDRPERKRVSVEPLLAGLKAESRRRVKLGRQYDDAFEHRAADAHFAFANGVKFAMKQIRQHSAHQA